jgi:hypothetical protein
MNDQPKTSELACGEKGCQHPAPFVYWQGAGTTNNGMGSVGVTGMPSNDPDDTRGSRLCHCCALRRYRVGFGYSCAAVVS